MAEILQTTPKTDVPEVDTAPIETGFKKFPFAGAFEKEQRLGEKAVEAKVTAERLKTATEAGEKRKALEKISAEDKAFTEAIEKQQLPPPEFKPTQDNAMELGGLFSVIATMGVALGGGGKLSSMNALNAMGGMLKGWQSGRKDLFEKEQKIFDKEVVRIKEINDRLLKKLDQYQKLRVTDKEAALLLAQEISAENPGVIAALLNAGRTDVAQQIATRQTNAIVEMAKTASKHGVSGKGVYLENYFPGITFGGTPSQNEEKRSSINAGALSLATAQDLKQYAKENPQFLGRQGQIAQNVDRYIKSWKASGGTEDIESMPDDGQPALIFAKKYAAYLVGYERTLAGSNRGMTVSFQNRFNTLMSQNQFNAQGFEELMNEQMNEVARTTASKDPAITGRGLLDYGNNIYKRAELPTAQNIRAEKAAQGLPPGIPEGSKYIGNTPPDADGKVKKVYQAPDGTKYTE
jgi:hypothetical protein